MPDTFCCFNLRSRKGNDRLLSTLAHILRVSIHVPAKGTTIYDEYNELHTIEQLKEELINWAKNQERRIIHYDDYIGDIEAPIDHVEMDQRDNRTPWLKIHYWHDKDGYDFTDRSFS